jgi:hypothetical protein
MKITTDHSKAYLQILPFFIPTIDTEGKGLVLVFGWWKWCWMLWLKKDTNF